MPKFDVDNPQVLIDFQIPEPPLTLHPKMSDGDVALYIKQELKRIHENIFIKIYSIFSFQNVFMLSLVADYTIFWQLLMSRKIKSKVYVGHRPATLPIIHYL